MNRKTVVKACSLLMAVAIGLPPVTPALGGESTVSLNDFEWTVGKIRSETSVRRHPATCAFLWGDSKEDFRPEKGNLTVITITLKSKKTGVVALTPEFFLMPGTSHWHHLCQGVRVVDPKPMCGEAFFPPSRGNGLQIYHQQVTAGQSIVIELVFRGKPKDEKGIQILAASPVTAAHGAQE